MNILLVDLLNTAFSLLHWKEKDPVWEYFQNIKTTADTINAHKIIFCADKGQSAYRLAKYPQYKEARRKRREEAPEKDKAELKEFFDNVNRIRSIAPWFGIEVAEVDRCEADDIIAYFILNKAEEDSIYVLSSDTDLHQLIRDKVQMKPYSKPTRTPDGKIHHSIWINEHRFKELKGITPYEYSLAKSIAGDPGDSISSPEGVGEGTAIKLIQKYKSIDGVELNLGKLDIPRMSFRAKENLEKDFWMVHRNLELIGLFHTPEVCRAIFGDTGLAYLEGIKDRLGEPPAVDEEALKEFIFTSGKVGVYDNFGTWVRTWYGR